MAQLNFNANSVKPIEAPPTQAARVQRSWSPQQQAIFSWFQQGRGNLVVRARAGTGKTTTILEGISHAPEDKILLAAFNKRIAEELKNKLSNGRAEAKTLHSLGFAFMKYAWKGVKIDSDGERVERHAKLACGQAAPIELRSLVSRLASLAKECAPFAKTTKDLEDLQIAFDCVTPDEFEGTTYSTEWIALRALKVLELAKQEDGIIDFSDMLYVPLVCGYTRAWFNLVVIDEAQDMNYAQLLLAQRACKRQGRIAVVGDDRQAIYAFRGADSGSIDRLKRELRATELGLTITYRCPKAVVALASRIVPDFSAAPTAPDGQIFQTSINNVPEVAEVGDFVLSRKNAPLVTCCLRILRSGKRARIEGRDIGQGLCKLVDGLASGAGSSSLASFLERLHAWKLKHQDRWLRAGKENKANEVRDSADTLAALSEGLSGVPEMKRRIQALFGENVANEPCVVLSSVHKAKGLEAKRVFLLENTFMPDRPGSLEESNIRYVGITRAKETLVLAQGDL